MKKKHKRSADIVIETIEADMEAGILKEGDKLPAERELADTLGVSRTSVRDAFLKLELDGIIDIKHGKGSFVKAGEPVPHILETTLDTEDHLLYEMLEFRAVLEVEAARLAAQRATSNDLQKIQAALERMAEATTAIEAGIEADVDFHMSIVEASHNSVFIHLMQTMQNHMKDTIRTTRRHRFSHPHRYEDTFEEHRDIYLAIASKDETRAEDLMMTHIVRIRRELSESMLERE